MTWRGEVEHRTLYVPALSLAVLLKSISSRLRHDGTTSHMFHIDAAERCQALAVTLESAVALAERDFYGPAFALLRTALEQTLVDKLVFSGRRHVQLVKGVPEELWNKWEAERANGSKWVDVTDWRRTKKSEVRIVREGLFTKPREDGSRQAIGPHYFLLRDFSPFVGSPAVHEQQDDGLSAPEDRRAYAEQHKFMYNVYLKWSSLKENLKANGFAGDDTLAKLDVHYRFLSAFVHPISDVTRLLYGNDAHMGWPVYDHYSSELVLLYAVVMAVDEIRNFRIMTRQEPTVEVEDWEDIEKFCTHAWEASGHLWYPGQQPHAHDRFEEANRRVFREFSTKQKQIPPPDPASLPEAEIGYYANPLKRLVQLHGTTQEIKTGLAYASPWPRYDARIGRYELSGTTTLKSLDLFKSSSPRGLQPSAASAH